MLGRDYDATQTGHSCNGNKSSGLINPHLHYSRILHVCSPGKQRQKHFIYLPSSIRETWRVFSDGVGRYNFPFIGASRCLEGEDHRIRAFSRIIFRLSQISLCFRLFPEVRSMFQDDNAPVHMSRCVQTWLRKHEVEYLTCCAQFPDLNIIEGFFREISPYSVSSSTHSI
ncbi:hypothetical protein TNCV_2480091 [Trichonephila clavipes]|nr:hypothetical protein TNCV_2480091 [Trichonephila clavipes]